jgi:hypothetical protein
MKAGLPHSAEIRSGIMAVIANASSKMPDASHPMGPVKLIERSRFRGMFGET